MKIPITKPFFGPEEQESVVEVLKSGWVVQGPKVREFETRFAEFTKIPYARASTSCTSALHLVLMALSIGPGDEVIVPSFTWVATANVVEMRGARPVLADIDLNTFNVDPRSVEKSITPRTRAIIPVSLFGLSAPMREICDIAKAHNIAVIEDAACATGAFYAGKHAGSLATAACFSFHARKVITTGEGGMVVTPDRTLADLIESLRDHGSSGHNQPEPKPFQLPEFPRVGPNYRMTDLQGALGVAQIKRIDWILAQRARLAEHYEEELQHVNWLTPQSTVPDSTHAYQSYVCLFQPEAASMKSVERLHEQRNEWMVQMQQNGIATRPGTHSVHLLDFYRTKYGYAPSDFPNSYLADRLTVTLPLYPQMTETEQNFVIGRLKQFHA